MRLWTEERPYDPQLWEFYRPGSTLHIGRGPQITGAFRVLERELNYDHGATTMRARLEPLSCR